MRRKIPSGMMLLMMLFMMSESVSVFGASVDLNAVYDISTNELPGWPRGPEIHSDTGVLMEAETGMLLYDKGADELRYPSSITQLMTLLLAVENSSLADTVTFTETGIRDETPDSENIGMQLGEVMTMEDCLYAMIIDSANEVTAQIAEFVGGTEQNFIDMMNARAAELGCTNTHFANASGLPDPDQYTTARDMALIFREGIKNPTCMEILNTPSYEIPPTNLNGQRRFMHTHHPLFAQEASLHYGGCFGGKSGVNSQAEHTLVSGVEQNGVTYIAVVLRAEDLGKACTDSRALFDYGYQNFYKSTYRNGSVILPNGVDVNLLTVQELGGLGYEDYFFSNHMVGEGILPEPTAVPETERVEEVGDAEQTPLYQNKETRNESSAGETDSRIKERMTQ